MALYFSGYGAISPATQALSDAMPALDARMVAAMRAVSSLEADEASQMARHTAADALYKQINRMDESWFQRVDAYFRGNGAAPSAADAALYQKYVTTFPVTQYGLPDFAAGSPQMENDQQAAFATVQAIEDSLPATRTALAQAKTALAAAQAAVVAANKKYEASVKADAAAVVKQEQQAQAAALALTQPPRSSKTPLLIAAVVLPLLVTAAFAVSRKKSPAVAGYRRRRSRR